MSERIIPTNTGERFLEAILEELVQLRKDFRAASDRPEPAEGETLVKEPKRGKGK